VSVRSESDPLAVLLVSAVFMNGFEAGGYQACLLSIGSDYQLSNAAMGMLASVQLTAALIAPLIFGSLADRIGKQRVLSWFFPVEMAGCLLILLSSSAGIFLPGIFLVGFGASMIQYVAIAALQDAYPLSGRKKTGILTGMYSAGAFVSPLLCGWLLGRAGLSWKALFALLLLSSFLIELMIWKMDFSPREQRPTAGCDGRAVQAGKIYVPGVALLCMIMFIYVGFENGYAYFLNSLTAATLKGSQSYLALSFFWLAMIPSRLLSGCLERYRTAVLAIAPVMIAAMLYLLCHTASAAAASAISFAMGFFSGTIYPCVLNDAVGFAGGRTATVNGWITAATGLGGAVITSAVGGLSDRYGLQASFAMLGGWILLDAVLALMLSRARRNQKGSAG